MKKLILLSLLIIPFLAIAQKRDTTLFKAGVEFEKYVNQHSTGLVMQLAGGGLLAAGLISNKNTNNSGTRKPLLIGGGVLTFVGFVVQLISGSHIRNAAILLKQNKLVIPL